MKKTNVVVLIGGLVWLATVFPTPALSPVARLVLSPKWVVDPLPVSHMLLAGAANLVCLLPDIVVAVILFRWAALDRRPRAIWLLAGLIWPLTAVLLYLLLGLLRPRPPAEPMDVKDGVRRIAWVFLAYGVLLLAVMACNILIAKLLAQVLSFHEFNVLPWYTKIPSLVLAVGARLCVGAWLYQEASRSKQRAWVWGLAGLAIGPLSACGYAASRLYCELPSGQEAADNPPVDAENQTGVLSPDFPR